MTIKIGNDDKAVTLWINGVCFKSEFPSKLEAMRAALGIYTELTNAGLLSQLDAGAIGDPDKDL